MIRELKSPYTQEELGRRLKEEIERNNLSFLNKAATAKDLGCAPTTIFRWLNGGVPKNLALMCEFCKKYNIDLKYWLCGERSSSAELGMTVSQSQLVRAIAIVDAYIYESGESLDYGGKAELMAIVINEEIKSGLRL